MARSRIRQAIPILLLVGAMGAGCGQAEVGGHGAFVAGPPGSPRHLVVGGSPREMGVWQGRLLGASIRSLHEGWPAEAFGPGEAGRRLREACALYVDQTRRGLPERLRQELDGIAEGAGIPADSLLLTAVLRDGLRWHEAARPLGGTLALAASGPEIRWAPEGPDARRWPDDFLLIERRPADGVHTIVWTWPGSLGGLAGVSASGLGAIAAEVVRPLEAQRLGAMPFTMMLREALSRGRGAHDLLERLAGTTGQRVGLLDAGRGTLLLGLTGWVAVETADLTSVPFFLLPREERPVEVVLPGASPAPGAPTTFAAAGFGEDAAWVGVRTVPGGVELRMQPGGTAPARAARLQLVR